MIPAGFDILLGGAEAAALQLQLKERIRSLQLHLDQYRQYEAILQSSKRLENYLFQEYCSGKKITLHVYFQFVIMLSYFVDSILLIWNALFNLADSKS